MSTTFLEHLTAEDLDDIGGELDAIRDEVLADLGERDAAHIRKAVQVQRGLEGAGRAALRAAVDEARLRGAHVRAALAPRSPVHRSRMR